MTAEPLPIYPRDLAEKLRAELLNRFPKPSSQKKKKGRERQTRRYDRRHFTVFEETVKYKNPVIGLSRSRRGQHFAMAKAGEAASLRGMAALHVRGVPCGSAIKTGSNTRLLYSRRAPQKLPRSVWANSAARNGAPKKVSTNRRYVSKWANLLFTVCRSLTPNFG